MTVVETVVVCSVDYRPFLRSSALRPAMRCRLFVTRSSTHSRRMRCLSLRTCLSMRSGTALRRKLDTGVLDLRLGKQTRQRLRIACLIGKLQVVRLALRVVPCHLLVLLSLGPYLPMLTGSLLVLAIHLSLSQARSDLQELGHRPDR